MNKALCFAATIMSVSATMPVNAGPIPTIGTCTVSVSTTTGRHASASATVTCDHAKDLLQADMIVDWPHHEAKGGHYCASPPPYLPACKADAATAKLPRLSHYSYHGALQITGVDATVTAVTGSAARYCTTTGPTEIDCYFDGKR